MKRSARRRPESFTQHALERCMERAGIRSVGRALREIWAWLGRSEFVEVLPGGREEWRSGRWVLIVERGCVRTVWERGEERGED